MKARPISRLTRMTALLVAGLACATTLPCAANAQNATVANSPTEASPEYALIRQMVGVWDVQQRVWTAPAAEPMSAGPAVARRRLIGDAFLEEIMEPAPTSGQDPFIRIAYFSFNKINQRYEWISMDTRAPQMMFETSNEGSAGDGGQPRRRATLYLESFVLPRWGQAVNRAFKQRRVIQVEPDRQVVRQYWTPLSGEEAAEFLAVEYVYTRSGLNESDSPRPTVMK